MKKVEGLLKVKEIAGGGTTKTVLCDQTIALWRRDVDPYPCPFSLPFRIPLPTAFRDEHGSWVRPLLSSRHGSIRADYTHAYVIFNCPPRFRSPSRRRMKRT